MDLSAFMDKLKSLGDFLHWSNEYGVWGILQFLLLGISFVIGMKLIYFPRRRIRNLNFNIRFVRNSRHIFPSHIHLEFRNFTGRTVVLSSPFFRYRMLQPPPDAHGDTLSGEYEIKFPSANGKQMSEVEYLLRNKESVDTLIPLDPAHTEEEVNAMHAKRRIGTLTVMCTWLQDRPKVDKLVRKV
ncbi:MAG: hypothetical protein ACM3ZT_10465 [Bacillota bacterium]